MATESHETIIASSETQSKGPGLRSWLLQVSLFAILAAGWKLFLLHRGAFPFNADEAIVGLMARHILAGEMPIFFYGQAYMGSLDAFLAAGMFRLAGTDVASIRYVQIALYAITTGSTVALAWKWTQSRLAALAAGLLMVFPAVNTTLYTTVSLGGYGEALLLGSLHLHLAYATEKHGLSRRLLVLWAFLTGFGVWVFGLTLVFSLATAMVFLQAQRATETKLEGQWFLWMVIAGMVGASPWLIAGLRDGFPALLQELLGSAIANPSGGGFLGSISTRLINVLLFGPTVVLGFRPPWSADPLAPGWIPFVLAFWFLVAFTLIQRRRSSRSRKPGWKSLLWIVLFTTGGLILTPFGGDPSGRYFLPLLFPIVLGAAVAVGEENRGTHRWLLTGLLLVTAAFHVRSTIKTAGTFPGITTQFDPVTWIDHEYDDDLQAFLAQEGLTTGYSNYWVSYPLAFQSEETLIYLPWLPYHQDLRYTNRDDRYAPYLARVADAERIAYITTHHSELNALLEARFDAQGVEYSVEVIGDYHVYYGFPQPLHPEELDLPWLDSAP